jgi:16S rRNA (cytosine967-C5)-methyltransferase
MIKENCRRLGARNISASMADAREYWRPDQVDAVLIDAPCSGTGTLRRRADLRWRRTPSDLADLATLQRSLLTNAAGLVKRGGRLIYSTCSLEPEENEAQMKWFLSSFLDFKPGDLRASLPPAAAALCGDDPWLYLWPHKHGTDGFFVCRLERRGEGTDA